MFAMIWPYYTIEDSYWPMLFWYLNVSCSFSRFDVEAACFSKVIEKLCYYRVKKKYIELKEIKAEYSIQQ